MLLNLFLVLTQLDRRHGKGIRLYFVVVLRYMPSIGDFLAIYFLFMILIFSCLQNISGEALSRNDETQRCSPSSFYIDAVYYYYLPMHSVNELELLWTHVYMQLYWKCFTKRQHFPARMSLKYKRGAAVGQQLRISTWWQYKVPGIFFHRFSWIVIGL